jgi:hypothetical protein
MFARYSRSGLALMGLPLYAGPLLAGWSMASPATIAALAAMFFLMQLLAGKTAGRGTMSEPLFLALLALVQVVVVAAVFGAGVLLALAAGALPLPVWLPLGLTATGAVLGALRYRHNPRDAEMQAVLDQAIAAIETGVVADFDGDDPVQEALDSLWSLPEDARVADIDPIVQRLEQQVGPGGFHGLLAEVGEGFRAVDLGMLRYLASPLVRADLVAARELGFALVLLVESEEPSVIAELAMLTATLLAEGAPASELPPPEPMQAKARRHPELAPLVAPVQEEYRKWRAEIA